MLGLDNPIHILLLLVLMLLVFGAKRLPEMGRSLGTGLREFKETISGEDAHTSPLPAGQSEARVPTAAARPASVPGPPATSVDDPGPSAA